jgi:general secretion pathway protein D
LITERFLPFHPCVLGSVLFFLFLWCPLHAAWANTEITVTFENADLQQVIKKIGELTGTTFLFDPEQVKGKITLLSPKKVLPEEALKLMESALALQGYTLIRRDAGVWIVPAEQAAWTETIVEVVPLQYAKAEELAYIAPPGIQIVPYLPTNSLIISGDPRAVGELIGIIKEKKKEPNRQERN